MPSEFHNREPPLPFGNPKSRPWYGMDIFWNRPIYIFHYESCGLMGNLTLCCSLKRCSSLIFSASSFPFFISIWASLSFRTSVRSRAPWKVQITSSKKILWYNAVHVCDTDDFYLYSHSVFVGFNLLHETSWLYLFGSTEGSWLVQWLLFFSVLGAWLPQCQSLLFLPVDKKRWFN